MLKPEAHRASCVRLTLSVVLSVKTMGTAVSEFPIGGWGVGGVLKMSTDRLNTFPFSLHLAQSLKEKIIIIKAKMFNLI